MGDVNTNMRARAMSLLSSQPQEAVVYALLDVAAAIREGNNINTQDKE